MVMGSQIPPLLPTPYWDKRRDHRSVPASVRSGLLRWIKKEQTHLLAGLRGERLTPQPVGPLEAKLVHQRFAARPRLLAEGPAGGLRSAGHAFGSVDGAQEGPQMRRALHFD